MIEGAKITITTNIGATYAGVLDNINSAHVRIRSTLPLTDKTTYYVVPWTIIQEVSIGWT